MVNAGLKKESSINVSCREYYVYKLQIRDREQSVLHFAERLLQ